VGLSECTHRAAEAPSLDQDGDRNRREEGGESNARGRYGDDHVRRVTDETKREERAASECHALTTSFHNPGGCACVERRWSAASDRPNMWLTCAPARATRHAANRSPPKISRSGSCTTFVDTGVLRRSLFKDKRRAIAEARVEPCRVVVAHVLLGCAAQLPVVREHDAARELRLERVEEGFHVRTAFAR
jgi:hypothetical protein